jgi:hypothetical protein
MNAVTIRRASRSVWGNVQDPVVPRHAAPILLVTAPVAKKHVKVIQPAMLLASQVDREVNALTKLSHPMVVLTPALNVIFPAESQPVHPLQAIRMSATVRKHG